VKVENYILELLQWHECVIVPGIGGFLGHYAPAKIDREKNIFAPPSKHLAFNINLKNNDGLLVNHIAVKENIPFALASKIVSDKVSNWCSVLNSGGKVYIKGIGKLYFDKELNIQFEPSPEHNLLMDSFGLIELHSPAILRGEVMPKVEKVFIDRPAIPRKRIELSAKKIFAAIISVPVITAIALLPFRKDISEAFNVNYTGYNFESFFEKADYKPAAHTALYTSENLEEEIPNEDFVLEQETEEEISETMEAKETVENHIYIIAGCFSIKSNADYLVENLNNKGYKAQIVDIKNGLYRVCYAGYNKLEEATAALVEIKQENGSAWLLKK
jgi:hypothetical protein